MPIPDWELHYGDLLDRIERALDFPADLTFELISHRFTPGSKDVLTAWYPNSSLEMDESKRSRKLNKFGGTKYVYPQAMMRDLRGYFEAELRRRFPSARLLYWT